MYFAFLGRWADELFYFSIKSSDGNLGTNRNDLDVIGIMGRKLEEEVGVLGLSS